MTRIAPASTCVAAAIGVTVVLVVTGVAAVGQVAQSGSSPYASPVAAVGERIIGLSADGETFSDRLDVPLFDPATVWVPGDSFRGGLVVRNEASDDGTLSLELAGASDLPVWLDVETRAEDGWEAVTRPGTPPLGVLEPGEERRIEVRLSMATDAPQQSMRVSEAVRLRVRLTESVGGADDGVGGGGGAVDGSSQPTHDPVSAPDGVLPGTGASLGPLAVGLGVVMLGAGVGVLGGRRRRRPNSARHGASRQT